MSTADVRRLAVEAITDDKRALPGAAIEAAREREPVLASWVLEAQEVEVMLRHQLGRVVGMLAGVLAVHPLDARLALHGARCAFAPLVAIAGAGPGDVSARLAGDVVEVMSWICAASEAEYEQRRALVKATLRDAARNSAAAAPVSAVCGHVSTEEITARYGKKAVPSA
jgi:hypothetical protein